MTRTDISKSLRHYRKKAGLTQAQFGELTGFDPKTISRLETGDRTPSLDALDTFAHVLKIQVRDLFTVVEVEQSDDELRAHLLIAVCKANKRDLQKIKIFVDKLLASD